MSTTAPKDFCNWLSGILDTMEPGDSISPALTAKIKTRLDGVFEHIDVQTPAKPLQIGDAPTIRC